MFYAFYAWWIHFPQSGALAEGTSRPVSHNLASMTNYDAGGSPPGAAGDSAKPPHDKTQGSTLMCCESMYAPLFCSNKLSVTVRPSHQVPLPLVFPDFPRIFPANQSPAAQKSLILSHPPKCLFRRQFSLQKQNHPRLFLRPPHLPLPVMHRKA